MLKFNMSHLLRNKGINSRSKNVKLKYPACILSFIYLNGHHNYT